MIRKEMVILGLVALLVVVVGAEVMALSSEGREEYHDRSKEWCNGHGGDLYLSQTMGKHSGYHCKLPNGKSVHMHAVKDAGWTDNISEVRETFKQKPGFFHSFGIALVAAVALFVVSGVVQRFRRQKE